MTKRQIIPGVFIEPRIGETAKGKVEFDLTESDGPVVLSVHGGLGGADQARLVADWLAGEGYRILSPLRPGYLGTPLGSGATMAGQADRLPPQGRAQTLCRSCPEHPRGAGLHERHDRHDGPVLPAGPGHPQ
jgi:hypothetical protein